MEDDLTVKVLCPVNTYDRIYLEVESAIQELVPLARRADRNSPHWDALITALEHLRMAKKMSQEGEGYVDCILSEEEFPELLAEEEEEECVSREEGTD